MNTKLIEYNSPKHKEMINLRNKILREPLGLIFSKEDLEQEREDFLCIYEENNAIIGCCVLSHISNEQIKLRQMAVETLHHQKGIGKELLKFAEGIAKEKGYKFISLHARDIAKGFYLKNGYIPSGSTFIEIGLPHIEMKKEV